jgi:hypothetical protein
MTYTKRSAPQQMIARVRPAVITGIVLSLASYAMDFAIGRLGVSVSKTILSDLAIGVLGSLAVFFFLSASYEKQNFESAKERIILIRELNLRIREALEVVATSALSEERIARLQGIDEATDRIDELLSDLISRPKASRTTPARSIKEGAYRPQRG